MDVLPQPSSLESAWTLTGGPALTGSFDEAGGLAGLAADDVTASDVDCEASFCTGLPPFVSYILQEILKKSIIKK